MAKKIPAKDAKKPAAEKGVLSKAKSAVVSAAETVADAVSDAAGAAQKHVVRPVAEAVGIVEKKKPRAAAKKKSPAEPVALPAKNKAPAKAAATPAPARKKTATGKMMSKNVPTPPKKAPSRGPQAKAKGKS